MEVAISIMQSFVSCILIFFLLEANCLVRDNSTGESWGYEAVRENAFMFWWLFGSPSTCPPNPTRPFIMWLQGGPGASSTGFGNLAEIGPYDESLGPRSSTWYSVADLLFVDSPVGTGFSYVTPPATYTTTELQIDEDLYSFMKKFLEDMPEYKVKPFYIIGVSYGGKMGASFGLRLLNGVRSGDIQCNFRGVVLGDSWISPIDSIANWAPFLKQSNLVDDNGFEQVSQMAQQTISAVMNYQFEQATDLWKATQDLISAVTNDVNPYNINQHHAPQCTNKPATNYLMNTQVRQKLGIIPDDVIWDRHRWDVFASQKGEFMKPAVDVVGQLLSSGVKVAIFQGKFDLLCDTPGATEWINKLPWSGSSQFKDSPPIDLSANGVTRGYVKKFENLMYFVITDAGHMVPIDDPDAALEMLREIVT